MKAFKKHGLYISPLQFDTSATCAGFLAGGQDSCRGDSGGPMMITVYKNRKFPFYLIGIISYGNSCGLPNMPGIYARVGHYTDWIKEMIEKQPE